MEYIHSVILGIIQGIAEFLPISSSGHLVISDALLQQYSESSVPNETATMTIALHFGTLLSILVIYREEWPQVLKDPQLAMKIIVATIPVGLVGVFLNDYVDEFFQTPLVVGCALLITATLLVAAKKLQTQNPDEASPAEVSFGMAVVIGLFQAVAIIPGISRSGSTIAAGLCCGLTREHAARFSFLIAIPALAGAAAVQLLKIISGDKDFSGSAAAIGLGTVTAFVVGIVTLRWLLRLIVADRLHLFAVYCAVVGCLAIAWQMSL